MTVVCVLASEEGLSVAEGGAVAPEERWEGALRALEGTGAAVESERLGEAYFAAAGLCGIHRGVEGVLAAAREAVGAGASTAAGPTRLAAWALASGHPGPPAELPVSILPGRLSEPPDRGAAELAVALERLGVDTLGALAALPSGHVADRFGPTGARAHRLARGAEAPLRPRRPHEELAAELALPEGTAGGALERALELLVDRFLAAPERRGRTLHGVRFGALLVDGGSWSVLQGLGRPTASARTLRALLARRLEELPAPALVLRLRAAGLGPPAADQLELAAGEEEHRRRRLAAALREVRIAQGGEALLRVLAVEPASRLPERRAILTPFPFER